MNNAEVIGGVPLVSVIGTPRTMGERLGARLKPRLQVLSQYLAEQLCTLSASNGQALTPERLRDLIRPSVQVIARHEPSLWMEFEAMSQASDVAVEDLLVIHGYSDLLSFMQCQLPPRPSTFVCLDASHTADGKPCMAFAWYLDPALLPYLTLMRRIPSHGPATLTLTLAGLHPVAGLSEAGVAVACNELRVRDGACGHFTSHLLSSMLTAPSLEDALRRGLAAPRHGGGAVHGLAANGERFSLELSGQQATRLVDPLAAAPRVHTNHPLDEQLIPTVVLVDATSKSRLEDAANLAVGSTGTTPHTIGEWFGLTREPGSTRIALARTDAEGEHSTDAVVVIVLCPGAGEVHLRRSGMPGRMETIRL